MTSVNTPTLCKRCNNNYTHPNLIDLCSECFYTSKSKPYTESNTDIVIYSYNTTAEECHYCKSHAQYKLLFRSKFREWELYFRNSCIGCVYKMEHDTKKRIMRAA